MKITGRLLVIVLLVLGLTLASVSIWHRRESSRQAMSFWGIDTAIRFSEAESVQLYLLSRSTKDLGPEELGIRIGEIDYVVTDSVDVSDADGMKNLRQAVLSDASFDWSVSPPASEIECDAALRFYGGDGNALVAIDVDAGALVNAGSGKAVAMTPIRNAVEIFVADAISSLQPGDAQRD